MSLSLMQNCTIVNNTQVCMQQENSILWIEYKIIEYIGNFIDNCCDKTNSLCYMFNLFSIGIFFIYAFARMLILMTFTYLLEKFK